jgi:hypothetical protein
MRAFLIDPFTKTVTEVQHNGDHREIYQLIGCECFDTVRVDNHTVIYVDDEGLFVAGQKYFSFFGKNLAGKGLVLGVDDAGASVSAPGTAVKWAALLEWPNIKFTGIKTRETELAPGAFEIRREAQFERVEDSDADQ